MHSPPFHSGLLEESRHILWDDRFFREPRVIQMQDGLLVSLCAFLFGMHAVNFITLRVRFYQTLTPRDYFSLNIVNG